MCCLQEVRWRGHSAWMLGWREGDISCGSFENKWSWWCGRYREGAM